MKKLTAKQIEILRFIADFIRREHMPPTVYEIGQAFGLKSSTIFAHLRALQRKNYISRSSQARSIRLLHSIDSADAGAGSSTISHTYGFAAVPLIERPTPENTADPSRSRSGLLIVSSDLLSRGKAGAIFAFPVATDALLSLGIRAGDIAFASEPGKWPENGEIVLLYAEERAWLGGFFCHNKLQIELRHAQADDSNKVFDVSDVKILGTVIALQRKI